MVFILRIFLKWRLRVATNTLQRAFRAQGLRLTHSRRAILQVVATTTAHLQIAEVHRQAARIAPGIGLASVYRTIDLLDRLGLVKRVHIGHRHRHYAPAIEEHGHHLVCSGCGRVVEFSDCRVEGLARVLARRTRFVIEGHSIELYGRCPDCRASRRRSQRSAVPRQQPKTEVCRE
jgi:Fe2+ or Zn2+ uptake regulation protein